MPRCCSSRIQSEVAWRAALRPLTVPASWIAPPNSSSFSVSVVLPASGWEMIAKVRRRATSSLRSSLQRDRGKTGRNSISPRPGLRGARLSLSTSASSRPSVGLVVAAPAPISHESHRLVERDRERVRRPDLEERVAHPACRARSSSSSSIWRPMLRPRRSERTQRLRMCASPRAHRRDAIGDDLAAEFGDAAEITDAQTVAEDAFAPRERIRGALDRPDCRNVARHHGAKSHQSGPRPGTLDSCGAHAAHHARARARGRSGSRAAGPARPCASRPGCAAGTPGDR